MWNMPVWHHRSHCNVLARLCCLPIIYGHGLYFSIFFFIFIAISRYVSLLLDAAAAGRAHDMEDVKSNENNGKVAHRLFFK